MMTSPKTIAGGLFISFEGPEGAGKSTQVNLLKTHLEKQGYPVLVTREPGGTPLGEELRVLAKHMDGEEAPVPVAELLIMGASRAQHAAKVITPYLATGGIVICDRFADSTTVYQGIGRDLDMDFVQRLHKITTAGCWPAVTIVLDVPPEIGLARSRSRDYGEGVKDRFEEESLDFHTKVRNGFLALAKREPARFRVFSTELPKENVHAGIVAAVDKLLP
ncbi:MAG: dTMP kinase [Lentisphaeria bacterium]|nr:dTMP kinase [Lentisphaeria bacterium]